MSENFSVNIPIRNQSIFQLSLIFLEAFRKGFVASKYAYHTNSSLDEYVEINFQKFSTESISQSHYLQFSIMSDHKTKYTAISFSSFLNKGEAYPDIKITYNYLGCSIIIPIKIKSDKDYDKLIKEILLFDSNSEKILYFITQLTKFSDAELTKKNNLYIREINEINNLLDFVKYDEKTQTFDFDEIKPSDESVDSMIQTLSVYETFLNSDKKRTTPTINTGPFRICTHANDNVQLCIGSIPIFYEKGIKKFKYFRHPGFNLFTYLAEKNNRVENISTLTAKRIISLA